MHYHVTMGTGQTILAATTYTDPDETAEAFVDLTFGVFDAKMKDRIQAELQVKEQINDGTNSGGYVEGGPLTIMWMECNCQAVASHN